MTSSLQNLQREIIREKQQLSIAQKAVAELKEEISELEKCSSPEDGDDTDGQADDDVDYKAK